MEVRFGMSRNDAAAEAGVSPQAISAAIKKGTLRAEKFEGMPDWDIKREDFEAWMGQRSGLKRGPKSEVV